MNEKEIIDNFKKSIWHTPNDEPVGGIIIVLYNSFNHNEHTVINWDTKKEKVSQANPWQYLVWKLRVIKWMYIDDIEVKE